jgi:hypothetical protein
MQVSNGEAHSNLPTAQPSLFGGAVPDLTHQEPPKSPPSRQDIIERTYAKAEADFLERYRKHLLAFGDGLADFTACDVTTSFESLYGKLSKIEGKQLGGLYRRLQFDGTIEKTGQFRERNQGNVAAVYRLKK